MAERTQLRQGHYRDRQLLAQESEAGRVEEMLQALDVRGLDRTEPDGVGLVRFSWNGDADSGEVVDEVRRRCRERWNGWEAAVAPNHILTRGFAGVSEERMRAMSDDIGGPAGPAAPTADKLASRKGADPAGTGVTVGVADTGAMRPASDWLHGSFLARPTDVDELAELDRRRLDPQDGHGTFIAGVILQHAPGAVVRHARVLDANGETDIQDLANAIERLGREGCDIINVSAGGRTRGVQAMMAFGNALRSLPPTTVVVAAAGNHDPEDTETDHAAPFWPAAVPGVVAVAALDEPSRGLRMAGFSNFGPWVDVAAPGVDVFSTFLHFENDETKYDGWATWSGTSFATPQVAGAIAARMTDDGVKVRSALDAKRALLAEAPYDPAVGRYLRPTPKIDRIRLTAAAH